MTNLHDTPQAESCALHTPRPEDTLGCDPKPHLEEGIPGAKFPGSPFDCGDPVRLRLLVTRRKWHAAPPRCETSNPDDARPDAPAWFTPGGHPAKRPPSWG